MAVVAVDIPTVAGIGFAAGIATSPFAAGCFGETFAAAVVAVAASHISHRLSCIGDSLATCPLLPSAMLTLQ